MDAKMVFGNNHDDFERILSENQEILDRRARSGTSPVGLKEIEFFCQMPSKEDALVAKKHLISEFSDKRGVEVLVQSADEVIDCVLSLKIKPNASLITEIEVRIIGICEPFGGHEVSWGFFEDTIQ